MSKQVLVFAALVGGAVAQAIAANVNGAFITPVAMPTLDEIGLGVLMVALAAAGGWAVRRKK